MPTRRGSYEYTCRYRTYWADCRHIAISGSGGLYAGIYLAKDTGLLTMPKLMMVDGRMQYVFSESTPKTNPHRAKEKAMIGRAVIPVTTRIREILNRRHES
jgi:hypothetical protein